MRSPRIYDKTKWHEGPEAALPGLFLGWAIRRDLAGDELMPADTSKVMSGRSSGSIVLAFSDGTFSADMLAAEGRRFADAYYATGQFATDTMALLSRGKAKRASAAIPRVLTAAIEGKIDRRFAAWRKASGAKMSKSRGAPRKVASKPSSKTPAVSASAARLAKLRARARKPHDVDPEHLIAFVQLGDPGAAAVLRELASAHAWRRSGRGYVWLGSWVDAIATYLEGGVAKLEGAVRARSVPAEFALGVLEEVQSLDAVKAVIAIAVGAEKKNDHALLADAIDSLANLLDGEGKATRATIASPTVARSARELAHRRLGRKLSQTAAYLAYRILGAVGDRASLELLEARPPFRDEYARAERPILAALRAKWNKR